MHNKVIAALLFAAMVQSPAFSQALIDEAPQPGFSPFSSGPSAAETSPLPVRPAPARGPTLPAGTEVVLRTLEEITTKGDSWTENDTFSLSVVQDVYHEGYVVIPKGSRAVGRIKWLTSKGMFGKSGKMDIELEYVEVHGRRIMLDGTFRQEGEGNTLATVGGVVIAGVFGGFITGESARIPRGRELVATVQDPVELAVASAPTGIGYASSQPPAGPFMPRGVNLSYEQLVATVQQAQETYSKDYMISSRIPVRSFTADGGALIVDADLHPASNPDTVARLICDDYGMRSVMAIGGTVALSYGVHDFRMTREICRF
jgi:hypothetical protein